MLQICAHFVSLFLLSVAADDISPFQNGGALRHSKYFQCSGSEHRLSQCTSSNYTYSSSDTYDGGMRCSEG